MLSLMVPPKYAWAYRSRATSSRCRSMKVMSSRTLAIDEAHPYTHPSPARGGEPHEGDGARVEGRGEGGRAGRSVAGEAVGHEGLHPGAGLLGRERLGGHGAQRFGEVFDPARGAAERSWSSAAW